MFGIYKGPILPQVLSQLFPWRTTSKTTMPTEAIRYVTKVDLNKPGYEQPQVHNRWHPDVPFSETIYPGETVKIECLD